MCVKDLNVLYTIVELSSMVTMNLGRRYAMVGYCVKFNLWLNVVSNLGCH